MILHYLLHLGIGLGISLVGSISLGPLSISVVQTTINNSRKAALQLALGASVMEVVYCLLALASVQLAASYGLTAQNADDVVFWIQAISVPILVLYGLHNLLHRVPEVRIEPPDAANVLGSRAAGQLAGPKPLQLFARGFVLNLFNPMIFTFWLGVNAYLRANNVVVADGPSLMLFSLGAGVGCWMIMLTVSYLLNRRRKAFSAKARQLLNRIAGVAYMIFALYMAGNLVWG